MRTAHQKTTGRPIPPTSAPRREPNGGIAALAPPSRERGRIRVELLLSVVCADDEFEDEESSVADTIVVVVCGVRVWCNPSNAHLEAERRTALECRRHVNESLAATSSLLDWSTRNGACVNMRVTDPIERYRPLNEMVVQFRREVMDVVIESRDTIGFDASRVLRVARSTEICDESLIDAQSSIRLDEAIEEVNDMLFDGEQSC
jgi:hypothetical protein